MRVDLTINDVGKTWQFGNEQVWAVKSNGKSYSFYSQHKPVIGSYIPCMVEERQGATKEGKAITYRDARPIPEHILSHWDRQAPQDDVPNFPTPAQQASKQAEKPPEQPQDTPEWAKPGPKPILAGIGVIISALQGHFADDDKREMNFWQGFFSLAATAVRDYDDGKLEIGEIPDYVPDDVKAAYRAAANGEFPGKE